jgi:hypothetical protein
MNQDVNVGLKTTYDKRGVEVMSDDVRKLAGRWEQLSNQMRSALSGSQFIKSVTAANLLSSAYRGVVSTVREVVQNVENIPGVSEDTIDSVVRMRTEFGEVELSVQRLTASALGMFSDIAAGLGYAIGAVVYGTDAAADALVADEQRQKVARENAVIQKKTNDAEKEAERIRRELERTTSQLATTEERLANLYLTGGQQADAALRRMVALEVQLANTEGEVERAQLQLAIATQRLSVETALAALQGREVAVRRRLSDMHLESLPLDVQLQAVRQDIARAEEELAANMRQTVAERERAVELEERILSAKIRAGALESRQPGATTTEVARPSRLDEAKDSYLTTFGEGGPQGLDQAWNGARAAMLEYQVGVGDLETQWARTATTITYGMEDGIATSLEGLIRGTMTWGDALANIGNSIVTALIQAFTSMIAQWVASWVAAQVSMMITRRALAAADATATTTQATAAAAAWSPAAIAASIASFGGAAATGTAAYLGALLSGTASAVTIAAAGSAGMAGREFGGPVTAGIPYIVGEKRPELFVPDVSGTILPDVPRGGSGGRGGVNVALIDNRSSLRRWFDTVEGESLAVDLIGGREARLA